MKFILLMALPLILETNTFAAGPNDLPTIDSADMFPTLTSRQAEAFKKYTAYYDIVTRMDLSALHLGNYTLKSGTPISDPPYSDYVTKFACPKTFSVRLEKLTSYVDYHLGFSDNDDYRLMFLKTATGLVSPLVTSYGKEVRLDSELTEPEVFYMGGGMPLLAIGYVPINKNRIKWSEDEVEFMTSRRNNVLWGALPINGQVNKARLNFGPDENDLQLTYDVWKSTIFNIRMNKSLEHVECRYELVSGSESVAAIPLPLPNLIKTTVQNGKCSQELENFGLSSKLDKYLKTHSLLTCVRDNNKF